MDPAHWAVSAERLASDAKRGWLALKSTYERLGATVEVQPAQRGLPDMVFTANAGVVLDRKVTLARFLCAERQGEEPHNRAFFEALRARGVVDEVIDTPAGLYFEGAGDAIWDRHRSVLWTGHGQRSSREMQFVLAETYGVPTVALELVDPRFYHLDTCFCVLGRGDILYYPPGVLGTRARAHRGPGRPRPADRGERRGRLPPGGQLGGARRRSGLLPCHRRPARATSERGYRAHVVPLDSFNRSGGAAYCLALRLDVSTHAGRAATPLFVEDDAVELRAAA